MTDETAEKRGIKAKSSQEPTKLADIHWRRPIYRTCLYRHFLPPSRPLARHLPKPQPPFAAQLRQSAAEFQKNAVKFQNFAALFSKSAMILQDSAVVFPRIAVPHGLEAHSPH